MATYPLPTLACTITAAGITAPIYEDILESIKQSYRNIYGNDSYLEPDSQDGQWVAVVAAAINDVNQQTVAVYNSFSPDFAQGAALSSRVQLNGLTRKVASKSSVIVTIAGNNGTTIANAIVQDVNGEKWSITGPVTIGFSGTVNATAVAQSPGAILAGPNTVTKIVTPTLGWQSVTNPASAVPGSPVETDGELRLRRKTSVSLTAVTIKDAIKSNVEKIAGVGRVEILENDTKVTDINGIPGNSIAVVVEGGDLQSIVDAIGSKKAPGTTTFGSTSGTYLSPTQFPTVINYYPLSFKTIYADITITVNPGYSSAYGDLVRGSVANFINALSIGEDILFGKLFGPANLYGESATSYANIDQASLSVISDTFNVTSIEIGTSAGVTSAANIPVQFFEAAKINMNDITLTVV